MPSQPIQVLLVEDNPTDVLLLQEVLETATSAQFKLTPEERLAEGLKRLGEGRFDVLLLDLGLPDSQGLETFVRAHEAAPGVPIVVLTGLADETLAVRAVQAGAQDYLIKGQIDDAGLARAIRYAVERKRAAEALAAKNEELKAMSQQLWQAAKLATMGELAASIAHELNNPLQTVSLRVETLLAELPAEDARRRLLHIVEQELERMAALVANLLHFSRRSAQQTSTLDVRDEIEKTLELVHHQLRRNRITVARDFAPDAPLIQADRQHLRQLLLNLFTNASDAMPDGGTLTIRVSAPGRAVVVEVADTGVGISPDDLSRVEEPFFTTKPEGRGTGLGLGICRRVMQEHGGTFDIASAGLGQGTTVRATFPVGAGAPKD